MKTTIILCLAALTSLVTGCNTNVLVGSGRVTTETRAVSDFNAVALSGIGDLTITQGETEALTVEAEDNLVPYLKTEVRDRTLTISIDQRNGLTMLTPTKPVRFNLSVKNLASVDLSGAGRIVAGELKSDQLRIGISGAGSVALDRVQAASVTSTLSGAGGLKLSGQVTNQTVNLSGLGGYEAPDLSSQAARVTISGAGSATVWARDSLDVTISGAGSVNYYGSPRVQQNKSGAGSIKNMGNK